MLDLVISVPESTKNSSVLESLLTKEWLVTNGLGGYASGTVCGIRTRRYHGTLVAALRGPLGRMMMLNDVSEQLSFPDGTSIQLSTENKVGEPPAFHGVEFKMEFHLQMGLPVWRYLKDEYVIEKRLILPHRQNTVFMIYNLVSGNGPVRLRLRPAVNFRGHETPVDTPITTHYAMTILDDRYELSTAKEDLRLRFLLYGDNALFTFSSEKIQDVIFWMEERRGFYAKSSLWSPGYFHIDLKSSECAAFVASTHTWETMSAITPPEALESEIRRRYNLVQMAHSSVRDNGGTELVLAADQFLISPVGRPQDAARARAAGYEICTVIAGYHWFTDWGRDTMISLEGLTLATGRFVEAGSILRTFGHYVKNGLIPNMFPEGEKEGLYHTSDATLWFFHAIDRYLHYTNDRLTLNYLFPKLLEILECHVKGTKFGIKVDPNDGLLSQGKEGYALTWMDAKVGDWVVTPRLGKTVEINALWYNALTLMYNWLKEEGQDDQAGYFLEQAEKARKSFNEKFWYKEGGYLYDIVDGRDGLDNSCRPNQVLAISLPHPILERSNWESVMNVVAERLLTPMGLRSLSPGHRDFKAKYYGDLRARDAAYHQGTVWGWLIGPYIDAWLKLHPGDNEKARQFLAGLCEEMNQAGIGSISEIFDAEQPYMSNGCIAQAWSVAEVLRCWLKTRQENR
jgi:predicted glycogen debranching enzyme